MAVEGGGGKRTNFALTRNRFQVHTHTEWNTQRTALHATCRYVHNCSWIYEGCKNIMDNSKHKQMALHTAIQRSHHYPTVVLLFIFTQVLLQLKTEKWIYVSREEKLSELPLTITIKKASDTKTMRSREEDKSQFMKWEIEEIVCVVCGSSEVWPALRLSHSTCTLAQSIKTDICPV